MKGLRTEFYQMLYEQPIYPKNLYMDREPMKHAEYREKVIQKQIDLVSIQATYDELPLDTNHSTLTCSPTSP